MREVVPLRRRPRRVHSSLLQGLTTKHHGSLFDDDTSQPLVVGLDASLTKYGASIYGLDTGDHFTALRVFKTRGAQRLAEIYDFIDVLLWAVAERGELKHIVMEDYAPGARGKTFSIGEGGGVTKLALLRQLGNVQLAYPTLVRPNTLKKFVTGSGNAEKDTMMLRVFKKWGVELAENNLCDAYSLARLAAALHSGATEYGYEAEVVASLERNTEWLSRT